MGLHSPTVVEEAAPSLEGGGRGTPNMLSLLLTLTRGRSRGEVARPN